jgi:hypothetical protein
VEEKTKDNENEEKDNVLIITLLDIPKDLHCSWPEKCSGFDHVFLIILENLDVSGVAGGVAGQANVLYASCTYRS